MGFDQYHEPPEELSAETRTFARLCASLTEEAEAIGWYEQRLAVEADAEARGDHGRRPGRGVQALRDGPRVPPAAHARAGGRSREGVLFQDGDIVEHGEAAEAGSADGGDDGGGAGPADGSLGIGSLKGEDAMNHLLRQLAPISDAGWELLDDEARERLHGRAGGPPAGRLRRPARLAALGDQPRPHRGGRRRRRPMASARAQRRVLPLVELRAEFSVSRAELRRQRPRRRRRRPRRSSTRPRSGSPSPRTSPSSTAGRRPASPASPRPRRSKPQPLGDERRGLPALGRPRGRGAARGRGRRPLRARPRPRRVHAGDRDRRARRLPAVRPPGEDPRRPDRLGARASRARSCSACAAATSSSSPGQDLAIGYSHHDADAVHLYLEESFSFVVATPEAAAPLSS